METDIRNLFVIYVCNHILIDLELKSMLDTICIISLSTQVIMQLFTYAAVLVCCTGSSISSIRHFMLMFWRYTCIQINAVIIYHMY